jgi:hypothetical protein
MRFLVEDTMRALGSAQDIDESVIDDAFTELGDGEPESVQ